MVKRTVASFVLVMIAAVSILAQIDYNKQIKNAPAVSQGNMNGVRVVDGLKFAQSAAGINAADADLGTAFGEIWIPSTVLAGMTATDAQISISKNHTLRLMGRLNIDSVNKGPILLATGAKIICNDTDTSPIINVGVGTSPSLIRLAVQDGSVTDGLFVEGCLISAGVQPVTNGVIDASGSANLAYIRNNYIFGFTSGWGISVYDVQSGAMAGTDNLAIQGNNITASNPGTGGCIEIIHSSTNSVTINNISIIDTTCIPGPTVAVGASILVQNLAASTKLEQINLLNVNIFANPTGQNGVQLNGVFQATAKQVFCGGGSNCVLISSNTNNLAISAENVACSGCTNSLQDIANNYINNNNYINHYGFNASSQGFSGANVLQGVTTTGNFNNIRIVDCIRFACSAAGINAADADLGSANGEVWVPTNTNATDAQISIRAGHTLRIFQNLGIDASASHGPILLGDGARLSCVSPAAGGNGQIVQNVISVTLASMVRLTAQDGSQTSNTGVDGCQFYANNDAVTNGIIDFSGAQSRSYIRDNKMSGHTTGTGIFIQDIQSGVLSGTTNVEIMNNHVLAATGTGSCLVIQHSSTNAVTINSINITDFNCTNGNTSGNSISITNADPTASHLRQINISNAIFLNTPVGASSISLGGVQHATVKSVACLTGSSCVTITNNNDNGMITLDNILNYGSANTLLDQSAANVTITTNGLDHYDFPINNTQQVSYLNNVSYLKVNGLVPSATGTGFGTGPTFTMNTGSTNNAGLITITTGTTPSSSGTLSLNFNTTQSVFGVNPPACVWTLEDSSGAWAATAGIHINNATTSQSQISWFNGGTNLTAAVNYQITYWCAAK